MPQPMPMDNISNGLLGCPASFQQLIEGVLRNNVSAIVYIDILLVHTKTQEDHLQVPEQVLQHLHTHNLKFNLDKCFFGNKEMSFLGFTLTPEGVKPGKNKLMAIKDAKPPTDVKTIMSFVGVCNFFRTHIKNLVIIATPFSSSQEMILATRAGPYQKKQWMLSAFFKFHSCQNQSWPFPELTGKMRSSLMQPQAPPTLPVALGLFLHKKMNLKATTQYHVPRVKSRPMKNITLQLC
jgi:hypothetical protein